MEKLNIGIEYFEREEYSKAYSILIEFAENGNAQAQCYIATMYHLGLGLLPDGKKAVDWYRKVAQQHLTSNQISAIAYNNLSCIYTTGVPGILPNRDLAIEYQEQSIRLGFGIGIK